jgi:hypothetical protein
MLDLIPYNIETFIFQARIFDKNKTYNFNMLPDSIKTIIIKNPYEQNNKFVINKKFPKLKNIEYHHFIHSSEEEYNIFNLEVVDKDLYDYINYHRLRLYIDY